MRVAVLVVHDPSSAEVLGFVVQYGVVLFLHVGRQPLPNVPGRSASWFRGKRGNLGFATISREDAGG